MFMTVGIVGLGLIGGSFARAYSAAGHTVFALDSDPATISLARNAGALQDTLTKDNVSSCDLVLICLYPLAAVRFLEEFGPRIGHRPVVIDCCGTKRKMVQAGMDAAKRFGFTFAGGHPMAGTQFSGFARSRENMYHGAPMVIVPPRPDDEKLLSRISELLAPAGFGSITVTSAEKHDEMIAFTSQLAHVVSNAYVKSPSARMHKGFSAGSYKDLTRVAWLNPQMWTELFLDNRDNLLREIDGLIDHLQEYRDALEKQDTDTLARLLAEGKKCKEEIDG